MYRIVITDKKHLNSIIKQLVFVKGGIFFSFFWLIEVMHCKYGAGLDKPAMSRCVEHANFCVGNVNSIFSL